MARGSSVLSALFGAVWAMEEAKFYAVLDFLEEREGGARFSAEEVLARIGAAKTRTVPPADAGVAVLPVFGVIAHRAHMVQQTSGPGGTSTELLGKEFDQALADPSVGTIVLDVSSPGGTVYGVQELADKIFAARGVKPVIAVANSLAASAAYWIASAAEQLVVSPSGEVGSIGVYAVHTDSTRRDANQGVQRTVLKAGEHKAEGVHGPMSQDAQAYALQQLEAYRQAFGESLARNRGVSVQVALGPSWGAGRTVLAREAVARGMADRVGTLEEVLQSLGVGSNAAGKPLRAGSRARAQLPALEVAAVADRNLEVVGESVVALELGGAAVAPEAMVYQADVHAGASDSGGSGPAVAVEPLTQELGVTLIPSQPAQAGTADGDSSAARSLLDRQTRILELCQLAGVSMDKFSEFVGSTMSPDEVRAALQAERAKPAPVAVHSMRDREAERGFASVGEQLVAIVQAGLPGGRRDPRLLAVNAAASGMNEQVGSEGGFFLQADLLPGVMEPVYSEDPILSRVKKIPIGSGKNGVRYNVIDETSRANGSRLGGIQMYWVAEAETAVAKKPKLRQIVQDLKKIMGIGYLTEEMMEDAPAAGTLLVSAFQDELRFMLGDGIFRGTGVGQMLGFLNGAALATVAIEAGQTIANTPASIATNTSKMLARIPGSLWGEVIWLYNPELFPSIVAATVGNAPIFVGPNGMSGAPAGTIWGKPAFPSELCEAVGTPGDLIAIAPSQYHMADKSAQPQAVYSPHVRFLYDEQVMKITHRVDGKPVWNSTVTPYKGSGARSPFVALGTRA